MDQNNPFSNFASHNRQYVELREIKGLMGKYLKFTTLAENCVRNTLKREDFMDFVFIIFIFILFYYPSSLKMHSQVVNTIFRSNYSVVEHAGDY